MGSAGIGRAFQVVQKNHHDVRRESPWNDAIPSCAVSDFSNFDKDYPYSNLFRAPHAHSQHFEDIGRVNLNEYKRMGADPGNGAVGNHIGENEDAPSSRRQKRIVKWLKILLPHVGLIIALLSYIVMGAVVFIWLEADHELKSRRVKLLKIHSIYGQIINETFALCSAGLNLTSVDYKLMPLLNELSRTHEYDNRFTDTDQLWKADNDNMHTRWSSAAAILYALTVITSTGSEHVMPITDLGRIFTVLFGLVGIPLMFITAADIGKFLSEIVIGFYGQLLVIWLWVTRTFDEVRANLFRSDDTDTLESVQPNKDPQVQDKEKFEDEDERLQLPMASYVALIVGYSAIGSALFNTFENGPICLSWCMIIGLAVITASLDLCSSTLKRTFTKLHYFGRKIRGAQGFANMMSGDIRRITLDELKHFLEAQEYLLSQPYVPYNVHIFRWIEDAWRQHRDTPVLS